MSTFVSCPVQNACGASKLYRPNQQQEQSINIRISSDRVRARGLPVKGSMNEINIQILSSNNN